MADMRKAFLADVIENIDDDTPRLVFADWLEDHGDEARAEFIRLQCRLAAAEGPRLWERWTKHGPIDARGIALIDQQGAEWAKEAPKWATKNFAFYRGFVGRTQTTAREWLAGVAGLYRRVPVEGLGLYAAKDGLLASLADRPECKYLRSLGFNTHGISSKALAHFFASADLRRLVEFDYASNGRGIEPLKALLASDRLSAVRCLFLRGCVLGKQGCARLAASGLLAGLKSLGLVGSDSTGPGVVELMQSPGLGGLEALTWVSSEAGGRPLVALASSPYSSNLRRLHIGHGSIPDEALHALTISPHLTGLTELSLHWVGDSPAVREAIAESDTLIHLRRLRLNHDNECRAILDRLAERRRERGIE